MSDRLFFDIDVLLDHLLDREPFADDATELGSMSERWRITGCVSAWSFAVVFYIVRHQAGEHVARRALRGLRDVFEIIEVDAQIIHQTIDSAFPDFVDAV